jgi:hypothetical protein
LRPTRSVIGASIGSRGSSRPLSSSPATRNGFITLPGSYCCTSGAVAHGRPIAAAPRVRVVGGPGGGGEHAAGADLQDDGGGGARVVGRHGRRQLRLGRRLERGVDREHDVVAGLQAGVERVLEALEAVAPVGLHGAR